jgi:outer membrane protein insertion porin family/translocation and assembly module TamA
VAVRVSVFEGPRQVLDRILVRGNRRTDRDIILRALGVRAGDPVSRSRLLAMERNLYQLGVFSRVQVSLTPADLASTRRDVVVHVEEGRTRSLAYGVGYELDPDSREEGREQGPRGFVGYSQRNLFGRAHHFLMDLRVEEEETRFRALLDQPYLAAVPVGLRYELFRFEEDRESFSALRWIGRVEAHDEWRHGRFSLSIDHRYLELSDFPADLLVEQEVDGVVRRVVRPGILSPLETPDPLAEDPLKPDLQVASVIPGFSWDQRDDPVDPQRGWTLSSQLQVAFPLGRAEARFADLFLQHTRYLPLGERGILAGSLRLQAIEPLRSVGGTEGDNLLAIPLDERIYSGGRSTHRAFDRLELGIPGETLFGAPPRALPIGGTGLALLNLEYRLRLLGPVGGTVFFDWGQVFRDWRDFDASLLRPGAGLGVTYYSPIGPLRVDVGFNIDREPGEPSYRVNFNFGHPF